MTPFTPAARAAGLRAPDVRSAPFLAYVPPADVSDLADWWRAVTPAMRVAGPPWDHSPAPLRYANGGAHGWPEPDPAAPAPFYSRFFFNGRNPSTGAMGQWWIAYKGPFDETRPVPGYCGNPTPAGAAITNFAPYFPAGIDYDEYDVLVWNRTDRWVNRGTERFVYDRQHDQAWYTPDHYCHFVQHPY
ncbi:hypothetical protein [Kitasatospora sp. NPDC008115]|uniref:hypothetical protein n=1 Tax=Kitasatospora sp. NPDC008115 TaxID=3364022 RepID=UPI0036E12F36